MQSNRELDKESWKKASWKLSHSMGQYFPVTCQARRGQGASNCGFG